MELGLLSRDRTGDEVTPWIEAFVSARRWIEDKTKVAMNDAPIGVFDSRAGRADRISELRRRLPRESLLYYGDGKNCPYGDKTREQVTEAVDFAVRRLVDRGVKLIVVACNAATAMAIDHLRAAYPIPFVGLEPAVKPAALSSRSGVIGILATAATLRGRLFRETSRRYEDRVRIIARVGEGFVELVEQNCERTEEAYRRVERLLEPMIEAGADRIVLGCTHYPFARGDAPRSATATSVWSIRRRPSSSGPRLCCARGIEASGGSRPVYEFMTSADEAYRQRLAAKSEEARTMRFE
ncbi:MAG: glutamate racemase [Alistipes sp.]